MNEETSKKITAIFLIFAIVIAVCMIFLSLKNKALFGTGQRVGNAVASAEVRLFVLPPGAAGVPEANLSVGAE